VPIDTGRQTRKKQTCNQPILFHAIRSAFLSCFQEHIRLVDEHDRLPRCCILQKRPQIIINLRDISAQLAARDDNKCPLRVFRDYKLY
jgi:hypothetical protein